LLRIVAGTHKGRALAAPPGHDVRPTASRAREALFDILAHARFAEHELIEGARVLDAFAGTGALGRHLVPPAPHRRPAQRGGE